MSTDLKAIVMGGGQGSRLRPLTVNRPKPLVPVCNKPVMEYTLDLLRRHGIRNLWVTLHYLADEVMAYFGDGADRGLHISYSLEDEPLGTAGSVKKIHQGLTDSFLVISGDALTDFDLTSAVEFHRQRGAEATIVLTRVKNPLEFGVVITDQEGRVERFLEKPSWGEVFSDTINTGIYILEPSILDLMDPDVAYDFSKDVFPKLLESGGAIYGYVAEGYWCDIGSLDQYQQANRDMLLGRVNHTIPGEPLRDGIWIGRGTRIHPGAQLEAPVVIGRDCHIREGARIQEGSVIGDNCIIEMGCFLHRAIVWENTFIGRKVRCQGNVIGRQVTLKAHSSVGEGAVLGDQSFVGEGATLQPEVKIWPDKNIEPGANVSLSLIWGSRWAGSVFGDEGIIGLGNIEITPEFALKLGAAYGASLEKGAVIYVMRDAHPASRLVSRSIICGLVSVGVTVRDLRVTPGPVGRTILKDVTANGGVQCRVALDDVRSVQVQFMDHRGINISKALERKIENRFFREDFRRTAMDEVGVIDFPSRSLEQYLEGFFSHLAIELVRQAGFKVVVDYCYGNGSVGMPPVLGKLGCETVSLNAHLEPSQAREQLHNKQRSLKQLSDIVRTLKADLGVLFDPDAETLFLVDEGGQIIEGARLLVLMAQMVFGEKEEALVAVPVNAPSCLESIAEAHRGRIIRTRFDSRTLMHTATVGQDRIRLAGNPQGQLFFPSFSPAPDALFCFARLLEMMAREQLPLSELAARIPKFYLRRSTFPCQNNDKGRLMRQLSEQTREKKVELIDGIKLFIEEGWTLVVPDTSRPQLHLWSEAGSVQRAEELLTELKGRLQTLLGQVEEEEIRPASANAGNEDLLAEERAFHFWAPGRYLGVRARTYGEFLDTLHYIEPASLSYHFKRGDFSNWVEYELHDGWLAEQIRQLETDVDRGEELRQQLLKLFAHQSGEEKK